MSKATEQELADLHADLAKAYRRALQGEEVSPALLTSVANFLKHNNISADPEEDDTLKDLREQAREKVVYPFDPNEATH